MVHNRHGQQIPIEFSKNTIQQINIYHEASEKESIGEDGFNVKFTPTQKQALKNIFKEHNMSASSFIREAMDFWIELFPYRQKFERHKKLIQNMLQRLS